MIEKIDKENYFQCHWETELGKYGCYNIPSDVLLDKINELADHLNTQEEATMKLFGTPVKVSKDEKKMFDEMAREAHKKYTASNQSNTEEDRIECYIHNLMTWKSCAFRECRISDVIVALEKMRNTEPTTESVSPIEERADERAKEVIDAERKGELTDSKMTDTLQRHFPEYAVDPYEECAKEIVGCYATGDYNGDDFNEDESDVKEILKKHFPLPTK